MDLLLSLALFSWLGILVDGSSDCGACFNHPDFTSNYTILQAQTDQSEATIEHNLKEVPMKVDIQVKSLNSTVPYVFPGLGSAQRDDDQSGTYGGVVYKYNNMSVILYVPNKNDGSSSGTVIYTGDSAWYGPRSHNEDSAEVRVRTWSHCSFPTPDFDSQWIEMAANNGTCSFREIPHGLGVYPEYVSVQIKDKNSDWYSDGIGSSMTVGNINQNSSWGGVIYGFNDSHVRIWVPGNGSGSMYSIADGWGKGSTEVWNEGYIRVRVWGHFPGVTIYKKTKPLQPNRSARRSRHHISIRSGGSMDIDSGMIYVTAKALDGLNKGYSFPGMGAVQNTDPRDSFGGLVYGYGPASLPLWVYRSTTAQGYIIYINQNWGGGMMPQKSKRAEMEVRFWKPYDGTCPHSPITQTVQTHTDSGYSQTTLSHTANQTSAPQVTSVGPTDNPLAYQICTPQVTSLDHTPTANPLVHQTTHVGPTALPTVKASEESSSLDSTVLGVVIAVSVVVVAGVVAGIIYVVYKKKKSRIGDKDVQTNGVVAKDDLKS